MHRVIGIISLALGSLALLQFGPPTYRGIVTGGLVSGGSEPLLILLGLTLSIAAAGLAGGGAARLAHPARGARLIENSAIIFALVAIGYYSLSVWEAILTPWQGFAQCAAWLVVPLALMVWCALHAQPTPEGYTPTRLTRRLYLMMFLQYFVQGSYLPIASLYLQKSLGFDPDQVGLFGSAIALGPLFAPVFLGQLVDRHLPTQYVLAFCHFSGGVLMLILFTQTNFWPIVVLGTVYSVLYVPSLMLTNSLTFHHLRNREREFPLVRLWGTIGFVVPAWLIEPVFLARLEEGAQRDQGRGIAFLLAGVAGLVMALYALTLPHTPPEQRQERRFAPGAVVAMLKWRPFAVLVIITFLIAIVHKFYFVWNSPFLNDILQLGGITDAWEQRIASIGQISEVIVMTGLGLSVTWIGFKGTMFVGTLAYLLRCLVFALAISLDIPFASAMGLACLGQALHGFCFACFLAAAFMYVDRVGPKDIRGSMQNLYGTFVIGSGFVVGGILAGRVGKLFTSPLGETPLRDRMGIRAEGGLITFAQQQEGQAVEYVRDWPGVWLTCAVLAAVCVIAFALFFPRHSNDRC